MKLTVPTWFRPPKPSAPPPTLAELRDRLTAARAEQAQAGELLVAARARLQAERTAETLEAVQAAKQRAEDLAEMLTICAADVSRAEAEEKAAERAELLRQEAKLRAQLADRTKTDELFDAWYDDLVALVEHYGVIRSHLESKRDIGYALARLETRLGVADPNVTHQSIEPNIREIARRLESDFRGPSHLVLFSRELARLLNPR